MITEGNITNQDRVWKQITGIIYTYYPKCDVSKISVSKTKLNNWRVEDENGKKVCIISRFVLPQDMVDILGIEKQ